MLNSFRTRFRVLSAFASSALNSRDSCPLGDGSIPGIAPLAHWRLPICVPPSGLRIGERRDRQSATEPGQSHAFRTRTISLLGGQPAACRNHAPQPPSCIGGNFPWDSPPGCPIHQVGVRPGPAVDPWEARSPATVDLRASLLGDRHQTSRNGSSLSKL